ncbi:hypothetical protein E2L00_02680 [Cedecea colo]|uniref:Uncharacterized protein n=1 Tax=Cedecea colo TaxID=2552946 RepID=A0ABX0VIW0_9ENTR|nr:hypothetical protein [Cedecea colo]NIY46456.1 hypothetical protein [Cedecea colo]
MSFMTASCEIYSGCVYLTVAQTNVATGAPAGTDNRAGYRRRHQRPEEYAMGSASVSPRESPPEWGCEGICGIRAAMNTAQQCTEEALAQHTILGLSRRVFRKAPDAFVVEVHDWIRGRRTAGIKHL